MNYFIQIFYGICSLEFGFLVCLATIFYKIEKSWSHWLFCQTYLKHITSWGCCFRTLNFSKLPAILMLVTFPIIFHLKRISKFWLLTQTVIRMAHKLAHYLKWMQTFQKVYRQIISKPCDVKCLYDIWIIWSPEFVFPKKWPFFSLTCHFHMEI